MNTRLLSRYYLLVVLVIILAVFLRFFMLTNQSLWYDESLSLSNSDASTLQETISRIFNIHNSDRFGSLYFIVLFLWRQAFGDSQFALRALSAILGVGSVVVIFFTTLRLYGKQHALWSSLILALSSFSIYYSQEVRSYSLLIFLASIQLYFFSQALVEKGVNEGNSKWLFGISTATGLFANILMGIFSAALCLSHLVIYKNPRKWLKWWIPAAFFCLPVILYYLTLPGATKPESIPISRQGLPIVQNAIFAFYGILVGTTYGPPQEQLRYEDRIQIVLGYWPYLLILLIVAMVIFIALVITLLRNRNVSRDQRADYLFASLFITSYFFGLIFAMVTRMNWVPRHSFYLCLPLAILIPSTFIRKYRGRRNRAKRQIRFQLPRIATTLLIILNIYSLFNYYFNKNYWRDDYRSAAQYLIKNQDSSTKSLMLRGHTGLLRYYGDTETLHAWEYLKELKKPHFDIVIGNLTNNADKVFIAVNREHKIDPNRKSLIEKAMSDSYTLNSKVDFTYIKIYEFVKK